MMWPTRVENSPEFDAEMEARRKEREAKEQHNKARLAEARAAIRESATGWLPMEQCPFEALDDEYGIDGTIVVTDGEDRALATVSNRFGRPVFYKVEPEIVMRNGMMCLEGGEEDPREDLPAWWWEWELTDEDGAMNYAGGAEVGKDEVGFVPTLWTFIPEPPR